MPEPENTVTGMFVCDNPRCISVVEQELEHSFKCVDEEHGITASGAALMNMGLLKPRSYGDHSSWVYVFDKK